MNEILLSACKELIDDAKMGCVDLVFKEVCLEILARASHVLTEEQFKELSDYAARLMKEKTVLATENLHSEDKTLVSKSF
ncbi:MAG: hypothetical protein QW821_00440 [Candidatus Bathyarchaeia archaeon]